MTTQFGALTLSAQTDALPAAHAYSSATRWEADVTQPPYRADPTGAADSTAALRQAITAGLAATRAGGHATLIFPAGTYLLSGSLSLGPDEESARRFHFRGAGQDLTVLRLKDNCGATPGEEDFQDATQPRALLSFLESNYSERALGNSLEEVTLEIGAGNPGAIGLRYHTSLYGVVRNVRIRAAAGSGHTGLVLGQRMAGPGVLDRVIIEGFDYGLVQEDGATYAYGFAVGSLATLHQRKFAIQSGRRLLAIRTLYTAGPAPVLDHGLTSGLVTIGKCVPASGPETESAAVSYQGQGFLWAHNPGAEEDAQYTITPKSTPSAWEKPRKSPPAEAQDPEGPDLTSAPAPPVVVPSPGPEVDAAPAIQAALDSGSEHVYLPDAEYRLDSPLTLPPTLRWLRGNHTCLKPGTPLVAGPTPGAPVLRLAAAAETPLTVERFECYGIMAGGFLWLEHTAARELLLRDTVLSGGAGAYAGHGEGKLRLENVAYISTAKAAGEPAFLVHGQEVIALGLSVLADFPHVVNDGGQLHATGLLVGNQHGPYLLNMNGARTELNGVFALALRRGGVPPMLPAFVNDNSDLDLSLLEHSTGRLGYDEYFETGGHAVLMREFQAGEVQELLKEQAELRVGENLTGSALARYQSHLREDKPAETTVGLSLPHSAEVLEGETAQVRLERDAPGKKALRVYYQVEGEAGTSLDMDLEEAVGSIQIPAGETGVDLNLRALTDEEQEPTEALILRLTGGPGYTMKYGQHAVRLDVLDVAPQDEEQLLARYTFMDGLCADASGNGHHARPMNARYVASGEKAALSLSGQDQWVQLSPTLKEWPSSEPVPAPAPAATAEPPPPPAAAAAYTAPVDSPGATFSATGVPDGMALFAGDGPSTSSADPLESALLAATGSAPPASSAAPATTFLHEAVQVRTILLRFLADDTFQEQTLYEEGGADNGLSLRLKNGDLIFTAAAQGETKSLKAAVDPGAWVHVCAIFNAGQMRLFLDSRPWDDGTAPFQEIPADLSGAALGRSLDGSPGSTDPAYFSGMLGDVRIYKRALYVGEIGLIYRGAE